MTLMILVMILSPFLVLALIEACNAIAEAVDMHRQDEMDSHNEFHHGFPPLRPSGVPRKF